jgi:hypothetical protein
MKPQRFYIGQEVTMKARPKGVMDIDTRDLRLPFGVPVFGKVYNVTRYEIARDGSPEWYIGLSGFKDSFNESFFCPIVEDSVLIEELESVPESMEFEVK